MFLIGLYLRYIYHFFIITHYFIIWIVSLYISCGSAISDHTHANVDGRKSVRSGGVFIEGGVACFCLQRAVC